MISTQTAMDDALTKMWEYQPLDLGRYFLTDIAWDTNRNSSITVKHSDGQWWLNVDEIPHGLPFADRLAATEAGYLLIATEVDVYARALARHNVSTDFWERGASVTLFRCKRNNDLSMYHLGGTWHVILGHHHYGKYASATDATSSIEDNPPIEPRLIRLLEDIYPHVNGYPYHAQDECSLNTMQTQGLVALSPAEDDETFLLAFLTAEGRAAMDADPRGLPLSLRDIVLESAQDDLQRGEWSRYFGIGSYEDNARNLQEALESGLELYADVADSDPNELCIKATGTFNSGHSAQDLTIMLFCPHWTDAALVESATALINAILERRDALVAEAQRLAKSVTA
jgi:hypothetical protein